MSEAKDNKERLCRDCADLGPCSRDTGAHPDDPACTAFIAWNSPRATLSKIGGGDGNG